MTATVSLNATQIRNLDLAPIREVVDEPLRRGAIADLEQQLSFDIDFPREQTDPRELSEVPEVRLWFVSLDARYPWLPFALDWRSGELARYAAMLVPHQFSRSEGIQYNPEALEIFVMRKIFVLTDWLGAQGLSSTSRVKSMAQMLGYELDDTFFDLAAQP
jgi:hypothetical protein